MVGGLSNLEVMRRVLRGKFSSVAGWTCLTSRYSIRQVAWSVEYLHFSVLLIVPLKKEFGITGLQLSSKRNPS